MHGNGLKDYVDIQHDMIMSIVGLLKKKQSHSALMERSNARKNDKKCWIFLIKIINNLFLFIISYMVLTVINVYNT